MAIQGDLAQILSGIPVKVQECNIVITQPSIKEICAFGEDNFFMAIQLFTKIENIVANTKEGNSRLAMLSDFQLLLIILDEDKNAKEALSNFFDLIFPDYRIRFDPGSICFLQGESERILGQINPMNFEFFQSMLKTLFIPYGSETEEEYNPANSKAAAIAEKLKRGNQIRQQMKQEEAKSSRSIFASYASILSIGLHIDINVIFQYTPFQLYDSFIRYQTKMAYDFYQKVATTPLMDVSKMKEPDYWMDDIYK